MRNYIKIHCASVKIYYGGAGNWIPFYAFYESNNKPEQLTEFIEDYKSNFGLSWDGKNDIVEVTKWFKMNKENLVVALNGGNYGSSDCAFRIWNPPTGNDTQAASNIRVLFVDKSPRKKKEGRRYVDVPPGLA